MINTIKFLVMGTEFADWYIDVTFHGDDPIKASTVSTLDRDKAQRHLEFGQPIFADELYTFKGKNTYDSMHVNRAFTRIAYQTSLPKLIHGTLVEA